MLMEDFASGGGSDGPGVHGAGSIRQQSWRLTSLLAEFPSIRNVAMAMRPLSTSFRLESYLVDARGSRML